MAWTVRTPEGSLEFASLADVERAYRNGLVEPQDELRDGNGAWIRAGTHPALRNSGPPQRGGVATYLPMIFAVALALAALVFLAIGQWGVALALAGAVTLYLMRFNRRALKPAASYSRG